MTAPPPPAVPRQSGRYLFVFLLGLGAGVIGLVLVLRALESGKTWQDRYPIALMQLLSAHTAQLSQTLDAKRCTPTDTLPHLQALRALGNDLEPAYRELGSDRRFMQYAGEFRATLDRVLAELPQHCPQWDDARKAIGGACRACHQDFRN